MTGAIDEKVVERYLKVKTLWERSDGNERANAARVMSSMQNAYPGIEQRASTSHFAHEIRQEAGPTWTQAMTDAVGILAGFTTPMDVLNRYAPFIDGISNNVSQSHEPLIDPVEVFGKYSQVSIRDSVRGLRVSLDVDPELAAILDEFVQSSHGDQEIARMAHKAGDMVGRKFYTLLKGWKADQ